MSTLLNAGASANVAKSTVLSTPLHDACIFGNIPLVRILLLNGAHVNSQDSCGYTALMYAARDDGVGVEIMDQLLCAHADPCLKMHRGLDVLQIMVRVHSVQACIM